MEQDSFERWEGKVSAKLRNTTKEQAWPIVKDFFNLHKRFASLASCYGIHGSNGEPGCIRYCAGFSIPSNGSGNVSWSKERLVAVDDVDLSLKYEIVESNIGFKSYESTMRVISDDGDDGCLIEWSFTVDPVEGLVFEDLVSKYRVGLQLMAQKMEDEIAEKGDNKFDPKGSRGACQCEWLHRRNVRTTWNLPILAPSSAVGGVPCKTLQRLSQYHSRRWDL